MVYLRSQYADNNTGKKNKIATTNDKCPLSKEDLEGAVQKAKKHKVETRSRDTRFLLNILLNPTSSM